jgi:O-antigen/teichoic acid export membrane protein
MPDQQKPRRSLTAQAFWLLIAKTVAFMFAFALPVLLTRSLSQNEYGLFKQVFLVVTTAVALLPLGFSMSAYYYLPRENDPVRRGQVVLNILLFNLLIGGSACLVLVFWPNVIVQIFRDPAIAGHASLVGAVILVSLFSSVLETLAVANQELGFATISIVAAQLSRTVLLLGAAISFDSVRALLYAALIHGVVQSAVLIWYVSSRFPGFARKFNWSLTVKQVAYALPFGLVGLLYTIQTDLHNYFVSNRFNTATFAVYSIGVAQLPFIGILKESVSSVILPRVNYLQEQGQTREIIVLLAQASRKLSAVIIPVYVFLLITGLEFLTFMFTSAYSESWPIFAINLTMLPLSLLEVDAVTRAYGSYRFFLVRVQVVLSIVNALALWFCISRFGLIGAIGVVVGMNFILRLVLVLRFSEVLGAKLRDLKLFKDVGKVAIASAVAGVLCFGVRSLIMVNYSSPLLILAGCFIVFASIYLGVILMLGVATDDERDKVRRGFARLQRFVYD